MKQFLKLKPGHAGMRRLAADLEKYGPERTVNLVSDRTRYLDLADRFGHGTRTTAAIAGILAFCAVLYAIVITFQTAHGTVVVEVHDPRLSVKFDQDAVTFQSSGKSFRLKTTEQRQLQVECDGLVIQGATKTIDVSNKETKLISARLVDGQVDLTINQQKLAFVIPDATRATARETAASNESNGLMASVEPSLPPGVGWTDLFNGKDLTGWIPTAYEDGDGKLTDGAWTVTPEGTIRLSGPCHEWLRWTKPAGDFDLSFEIKVPLAADTGFHFLVAETPREGGRPERVELNIVPAFPKFILFGSAGHAGTQVSPPQYLVGKWNQVVVRHRSGDSLQAELNGQTISLMNLTQHPFDSLPWMGSIGISNWKGLGQGTEFRNIQLREQKSDSSRQIGNTHQFASSNAGWTELFNGKDLTGWIPCEDEQGTMKNIWQVQDGVITVPPVKAAFGVLLSERDYGDFQLQLEFNPFVTDKAIDSGDGGVFILAAADLKYPPSAIEIDIRNGVPDVVNTGDLADLSRASKRAGKGNEWNWMEITLQKRQLTVDVNGERVQDVSLDSLKTAVSDLQQAIARRTGRIALANHGGVVNYRNIRIRELKSAQDVITPPAAVAPFNAEQARAHQQAWAKYLKLQSQSTNSLGMKLELIPPGRILMGAEKGLVDNEPQHRPQHPVQLTTPFWMASCEVTQVDFATVTQRTPSAFRAAGRLANYVQNLDTTKFPVESLTWYDAIEFCNLLSQREQLPTAYELTDLIRNPDRSVVKATVKLVTHSTGYRLPTEAEWEYACRAGTQTPYYYVATVAEAARYSRVADNVTEIRPVPVGSLLPNAWGLHDMHGNVCEFCSDGYDEKFYRKDEMIDPIGPGSSPKRNLRGRSWGWWAGSTASGLRIYCLPSVPSDGHGFRLVRSIVLPSPASSQANGNRNASNDSSQAVQQDGGKAPE